MAWLAWLRVTAVISRHPSRAGQPMSGMSTVFKPPAATAPWLAIPSQSSLFNGGLTEQLLLESVPEMCAGGEGG